MSAFAMLHMDWGVFFISAVSSYSGVRDLWRICGGR